MTEKLSQEPGQEAVWTASDSTFGARLALIRQRKGWNAKEAALACGIPQQSWRTWETGVMPHGGRYFDLCAKIAMATGCDYGWLVDQRPTETSQPTRTVFRPKLRAIQGEGRDPQPRTPLLTSV